MKIGDGAYFLPIPLLGQPDLMDGMAGLFTCYYFLQLVGAFMV